MDFSKVEEGFSFFRLAIRLDTKYTINFRYYIKTLDILSNLGGLWQLLFVLFAIIVNPINELSKSEILINSLFNFESSQS